MSNGVIYNLVQYFEDFSLGTIGDDLFANVRDIMTSPQIADEITLFTETGGTESAWFGYIEQMIQMMNRSTDVNRARNLAMDYYLEINNRFGVLLPLVTIGVRTYNDIQIAQISSNSLPQLIGYDENGRAKFTTNFRLIYRR